MENSINISIVVPVFNSAVCIEELVIRTSTVMQKMNKAFELILVDDGSKDASWETIKTLKEKHPFIVGIKLACNYGQQNATLCGIEHAQGDWVVTMDDDLEYPPEEIPNLFIKQQEGDYDVVYGWYSKKKNWIRTSISKLYKGINAQLNKRSYQFSSFRLIRKQTGLKIVTHQSTFPILDEYISWYTNRITSVSIRCQLSMKNTSGYTFLDLYRVVRSELILNAESQLNLIRFLGGTMFCVNFIIGIIIIYRKLILSIHVAGYTSIIVATLFSSGLIIYGLGVFAGNISKIIKQNYQKPPYSTDEFV